MHNFDGGDGRKGTCAIMVNANSRFENHLCFRKGSSGMLPNACHKLIGNAQGEVSLEQPPNKMEFRYPRFQTTACLACARKALSAAPVSDHAMPSVRLPERFSSDSTVKTNCRKELSQSWVRKNNNRYVRSSKLVDFGVFSLEHTPRL